MNDGCIDVTQVIQQHDFDFFYKALFPPATYFCTQKECGPDKGNKLKESKTFHDSNLTEI